MPSDVALVLLLSIVAIIVAVFGTTISLPLRILVVATAVASSTFHIGFNHILDPRTRGEIIERIRQIAEGTPPPADFPALSQRCRRLFAATAGDAVSRSLLGARQSRNEDLGNWQVVWHVELDLDPTVPIGTYACAGRGERVLTLSMPGRTLIGTTERMNAELSAP